MQIMAGSSFRDKSINAKNNDSFSSRHLPREITAINSSTEVYYGGSNVGVPFTWESQPGTPKVKHCDRPLPPLTPPPSFIYSSMSNKPLKKSSKSNLLNSLLRKLNLWRTSRTPPSAVSSFSSSSRSSSHSVPSSPVTPLCRRGHVVQLSKSWNSEDDESAPPISRLCFGVCRGLSGGPTRGTSNTMKVLLGEIA